MREKNRFSILLEHLLSMANLKNYVLAKTLQYDESYISKWTSGKLLPTEKNYDKILQSISQCIVDSLTDETIEPFYAEYQLHNKSDLEKAVYDHLETEYNYVKDLKTSTGSEIASKITCYSELPLSQFIAKMKHPSLRKVQSLDVSAIVDILHLDTNYQLMIADFNTLNSEKSLKFPGVHFSMFINFDDAAKKPAYTAVFLMNMLTNLSNIDFNLYGGQQALGKIIFTVRDAYSISGMLIDNSHCLVVTTSEDADIVNSIYKKIKTLCNKETLLIRKTSMYEMMDGYEYEQSLFSQNQRWLFGHPTEHFLPDDLHQELLDIHCKNFKKDSRDKLIRMHNLTRKIIESSHIRILVYESAFTDFIVTGVLDFYGYKVQLTCDQKLRYVKHLYQMIEKRYSLELKTIRGGTITDFQHIPNPTLFLSDTFCYLRLETNNPMYNICVPNKVAVNDIFRQFFDFIWDDQKYNNVGDFKSLLSTIRHAIHSIEIMSEANN